MKKIAMLFVLTAIVIYCIASGLLVEEIVFAEMHRHPLGKIASYEDYEVVPLGRKLCFLKRRDEVIVADTPGNGKGYYYESANCQWWDNHLEPIGVSRSYIIMSDPDEILYGIQHERTRTGIIIKNTITRVPYYTIHFWDKIILTP